MSATFTDRFGQEYVVRFDGRQELLPPRASKPNPLLSALGWSRSELANCNQMATNRSKRYRERLARAKAELARLAAGGRI